MDTRAYISDEAEGLLRLTVREDCTLYSEGDAVMSATFPLVDDGIDYLFDAQPEQPFVDADGILAEHGWKRVGPWAIGGVGTGTYARVTRA